MANLDYLQITHGAESSAISDKTRFPFVARMSRANVKIQAHALVDVVQQLVKHTAAKLLSCNDDYCNDCALHVQQRAQELDLKLVQQIILPYQSFKNDAIGRCFVFSKWVHVGSDSVVGLIL